MNIFVLQPNLLDSARELFSLDPIRARKQLVECCQLLATVEHIRTGDTTMIRKDGIPYGVAHPHHPITKHMLVSKAMRSICVRTADVLARVIPIHGCSASLSNWKMPSGSWYSEGLSTYIVCRKGMKPVIVDSLGDYIKLIRPYFLNKLV